MTERVKADASQGGCWFCGWKDDDLSFSCEFDTFVHVECAEKALKKNPNDNEAEIIWNEVKPE